MKIDITTLVPIVLWFMGMANLLLVQLPWLVFLFRNNCKTGTFLGICGYMLISCILVAGCFWVLFDSTLGRKALLDWAWDRFFY